MPLIKLTKLFEIINNGLIVEEEITINSDLILQIRNEPQIGSLLTLSNNEKILVKQTELEILKLARS